MPKFVSKNLMKDEKIVYTTKLHWILYFRAIGAVLIGIILLIVIPIFGEAGVRNTLIIPGIIVIVIGIIYGFYISMLIKTSECVITNKRVILKKGIISTATIELLNTKIETIAVYQGILGKFFGYGNIGVVGSGGTQNIFYSIEQPFGFRKAAQDEIDKIQNIQM